MTFFGVELLSDPRRPSHAVTGRTNTSQRAHFPSARRSCSTAVQQLMLCVNICINAAAVGLKPHNHRLRSSSSQKCYAVVRVSRSLWRETFRVAPAVSVCIINCPHNFIQLVRRLSAPLLRTLSPAAFHCRVICTWQAGDSCCTMQHRGSLTVGWGILTKKKKISHWNSAGSLNQMKFFNMEVDKAISCDISRSVESRSLHSWGDVTEVSTLCCHFSSSSSFNISLSLNANKQFTENTKKNI